MSTIFLGFLAFMLLSYALAVGFFLVEGLEEFFPEQDPIELVQRYLIYYFFIEFFIRFTLQNMPILGIQPYLHLPIKKGRIIHYMLRKSQISVFNLLAILFFTPFALIKIGGAYGLYTGFMYWLMILGLAFTVHFKTILFKKKLNDIPALFWALIGGMTIISGLDYFEVFRLSDLSLFLFNWVLQNPLLALVPVFSWIVAYRLNYQYLINNTYPEELESKNAKEEKVTGDFGFLKRYGRVGELIALELKLILRHKRPRNMLYMSGILLFYGLIFYPNETYSEMDSFFLFIGIFVTGTFFLNHGQLLLSWESSYFDFVLTRKVSYRQYFEAKYYLFAATSTFAVVVSLAYGFFGIKIILFNLAAYLFNVGINIPMVMRIAMYNPKKIDLSKGAVFNYEGMGAAQYIMAIPVLVLPFVIYLPFALNEQKELGLAILSALGLIGFLFRNKAIDWLTKTFIKKRHQIAAGFRAQ